MSASIDLTEDPSSSSPETDREKDSAVLKKAEKSSKNKSLGKSGMSDAMGRQRRKHDKKRRPPKHHPLDWRVNSDCVDEDGRLVEGDETTSDEEAQNRAQTTASAANSDREMQTETPAGPVEQGATSRSADDKNAVASPVETTEAVAGDSIAETTAAARNTAPEFLETTEDPNRSTTPLPT